MKRQRSKTEDFGFRRKAVSVLAPQQNLLELFPGEIYGQDKPVDKPTIPGRDVSLLMSSWFSSISSSAFLMSTGKGGVGRSPPSLG
jgi:hypothetical protein